MIYEHTAQKRHFVIEWARSNAWGKDDRVKWVASCNGAVLAHGAHPEQVLDALLKGECMTTLDGINPASLALPTHLDGWRTTRG